MPKKISVFQILMVTMLLSCAPMLPIANAPCPCAKGWVCCENRNVCVTEGTTCPFSNDAGDLDAGEPDASSDLGQDRSRICNEGFCWDQPRPVARSLNALAARPTGGMWAVGSGYTILVSADGGAWVDGRHSCNQCEALDVRGIWALDDAGYRSYTVGNSIGPDGGVLGFIAPDAPYIGGPFFVTTSSPLTSIHGSSATDAWALGPQTGYHWNGDRWSEVSALAGLGLRSVWVVNQVDAWAVGDSAVRHWDGLTWSAAGTIDQARGVWADANSSSVFVAARGGVYVRHGNGWDLVFGWPKGDGAMAVSGVASNDVWAVGGGGHVVHFNGNTWSELLVHTQSTLNAVLATTSGVTAAGEQGALVHLRGGVETSSATRNTERYGAITAFADLNDRDVYAVTKNGFVLHTYDTVWRELRTFATQSLIDACQQTTGELLVLARAKGRSAIHVFKQGSWHDELAVTDVDVNAMHCIDGAAVLVGANGALLSLFGDAIHPMQSPTAASLRSVHGCGSNDLWAAGDHTLVHSDGVSWKAVSPPTSAALHAVHCKDHQLYVGAADGLYRFDGTAWAYNQRYDNSGRPIGGLEVTSISDRWSIQSTQLYRWSFDSTGTSEQRPPRESPFTALLEFTDSTTVVAGNANGGIASQHPCESAAVGGLGVTYRGSPRGLSLAVDDPTPYPHLFRIRNQLQCPSVANVTATLSGDAGVWVEDLAGARLDSVSLPVGAAVDVRVMVNTPRSAQLGESLELTLRGFDPIANIAGSLSRPLTISDQAGPPVERSLWFEASVITSGDADDVRDNSPPELRADLVYCSLDDVPVTIGVHALLTGDGAPEAWWVLNELPNDGGVGAETTFSLGPQSAGFGESLFFSVFGPDAGINDKRATLKLEATSLDLPNVRPAELAVPFRVRKQP